MQGYELDLIGSQAFRNLGGVYKIESENVGKRRHSKSLAVPLDKTVGLHDSQRRRKSDASKGVPLGDARKTSLRTPETAKVSSAIDDPETADWKTTQNRSSCLRSRWFEVAVRELRLELQRFSPTGPGLVFLAQRIQCVAKVQKGLGELGMFRDRLSVETNSLV
jgi:hypothetical protein